MAHNKWIQAKTRKQGADVMDQKVQKHSKRHIKLFNALAGIYGWGFKLQYRTYYGWTKRVLSVIKLPHNSSMLDIGCGTGAWAAVWADRGMKVTALDPSLRMIEQGMRRNPQRDIRFELLNTEKPYPYEDQHFDTASSCMVLHGLKRPLRLYILQEMKRVTKGPVVILDYNGLRNPLTDVIEWLEGGDYFHFQKNGLSEMQSVFDKVEKIGLSLGLCLYICK